MSPSEARVEERAEERAEERVDDPVEKLGIKRAEEHDKEHDKDRGDDKNERWVEVCKLQDIPKRGAVRLAHGIQKIAVFKSADDAVRALEDACPHKGGPLSDGIVHGDCVTCPLHNWQIDLNTGLARGADEGCVQTFPIRVDGNSVYIRLSEEPAVAS